MTERERVRFQAKRSLFAFKATSIHVRFKAQNKHETKRCYITKVQTLRKINK